MRIVQFTDTLRSGGMERQLGELLKGLKSTPGVECELIVMSKDLHYSHAENLEINIHYLLRRSRKDPLIFIRLYTLLRALRPDILHTWNSMCSIYAVPVVKLLGITLVNGFLRNAPPDLSWKDEEWLRGKLTFPFSDFIVANSRAGLAAYRPPTSKSTYIHNGFDFSRVSNMPGRDVIRQKYKIPAKYVVGMVASFSGSKDYVSFIQAAVIILKNRNDVVFVTVGDGPNLIPMQHSVAPHLRDTILFLGRQKQVEEIISLFTVGVLATYTEGISNTIMEYMALSKPVIATNCGGNRELVINGTTGFLVPSSDTNALADKILTLLDNEDLAQKFGQAGQQRIRRDFNLEQLTQNHITLYSALLR